MTTLDASHPATLPPGMILARRIIHWSLLPWMLFAMMSGMALSADDPSLAYSLMAGVWSYGPLALLCSLAGRMLWSRGHRRAAVAAVALPLAIVAAVVLGMVAGYFAWYA